MQIQSNNIWQGSQQYSMGKIVSLINGTGKMDIHMQKKKGELQTLHYSEQLTWNGLKTKIILKL